MTNMWSEKSHFHSRPLICWLIWPVQEQWSWEWKLSPRQVPASTAVWQCLCESVFVYSSICVRGVVFPDGVSCQERSVGTWLCREPVSSGLDGGCYHDTHTGPAGGVKADCYKSSLYCCRNKKKTGFIPLTVTNPNELLIETASSCEDVRHSVKFHGFIWAIYTSNSRALIWNKSVFIDWDFNR